jgi:uncharacterized membrane protein
MEVIVLEAIDMPGLAGIDSWVPAIHGGGDNAVGGELVGVLDSLLDTMNRVLESRESFDWFPGLHTLATNVHPMIVHFPIAFLTAFCCLKLAETTKRGKNLQGIANWMLGLGALGAVGAVTTGLIAEDTVPHGASVHEIMEWHGRIGLTIAGLTIVLLLWRIIARAHRSVMSSAFQVFLSILIAVCLLVGADLGGLMVYQHGVGVKRVQLADEHHHHSGDASTR